jgi:hypothetical protein
MKFNRQILYCVFWVCPCFLYGQGTSQEMDKVRLIMEEIKNTDLVSYSYSLNVRYPNNQKDHIKGEAYIDTKDKILYNECDAFTMIYSGHWYYRADHRKKSTSIINLDKEYSDEAKNGIEKDIFKNGALVTFIDSVVLKTAILKQYKKQKDTVRIELAFKSGIMNNISIAYNEKSKSLISYTVNTFQPVKSIGNKTEGISQTISCNNFRKKPNKNKYKLDNFFVLKNGKMVVNKYSNYPLYTKL